MGAGKASIRSAIIDAPVANLNVRENTEDCGGGYLVKVNTWLESSGEN